MTKNHHQSGVRLLRFATAGSVDDGKSTLIGRLLYDAKALFEDQMAELDENFDLARLTDGLRAEREQGITIDVAYRYFTTLKRRFVIADCPGHAQYTRNAVTGMSHADMTLLLVDVRKGVVEQTRRHTFLSAMLGLSTIVFCVNKMDLVGYSQEAYAAVAEELRALGAQLRIPRVETIPICALDGDNVTEPSTRMPWYQGSTLLQVLESTTIEDRQPAGPFRFPVQYVLRPRVGRGEGRTYAGRIASGRVCVGDPVVVLPAAVTTTVRAIEMVDRQIEEARAPASLALRLSDDVDVARGDMIASAHEPPTLQQHLRVLTSWMSDRPLQSGARLEAKLGPLRVKVIVDAVESRIALDSLASTPADDLSLNAIGHVSLRTLAPVAVDAFTSVQGTGRLVFIDPQTKETVGAGLVVA